MSLEQFKKIHLEGEGIRLRDAISRNFDILERILLVILNVDILDGHLLEDIDLSGTVTDVEHKLDRDYVGWFVVDKTAAQHVYRDTSSTATKSKHLPLLASGAVTVNLWVF